MQFTTQVLNSYYTPQFSLSKCWEVGRDPWEREGDGDDGQQGEASSLGPDSSSPRGNMGESWFSNRDLRSRVRGKNRIFDPNASILHMENEDSEWWFV